MIYSFEANDSPKRAEIGNDFAAAVEKELEPLLADASPYFGGKDKLTLVEVDTGSFLLRFEALASKEAGYIVPKEAFEKISALKNFDTWRKAVVANESVTGIWDRETFIVNTLKRLAARAQPTK